MAFPCTYGQCCKVLQEGACFHVSITFVYEYLRFFCGKLDFRGWSSQCLQQTELGPAKGEHAGGVVGRLCVSLGKEGTGFEG